MKRGKIIKTSNLNGKEMKSGFSTVSTGCIMPVGYALLYWPRESIERQPRHRDRNFIPFDERVEANLFGQKIFNEFAPFAFHPVPVSEEDLFCFVGSLNGTEEEECNEYEVGNNCVDYSRHEDKNDTEQPQLLTCAPGSPCEFGGYSKEPYTQRARVNCKIKLKEIKKMFS